MESMYAVVFCGMMMLAPIVFITLFFVSAPYGRHVRAGWGRTVPSRYGWLVMEAPASLIMLAMFFLVPANLTIYLLLLLWQIHYFHRAFIYPFTTGSARTMPWLVVLMAVFFNLCNGYLNGWHFIINADWYDAAWLLTPHFIAGLSLFGFGYVVTKKSDAILKELKQNSEGGYGIPEGFLYRWVSCPNYLGECIQWLGWALMTLSPAGWLFFVWTLANLVPRAISHQKWYRDQFAHYPQERKAIVPFIV